jgi:hypothetical protein
MKTSGVRFWCFSESEFPLSRGCAGRLYRLPSPVDTPEPTMGVSSYPTFLPLLCFATLRNSVMQATGRKSEESEVQEGKGMWSLNFHFQ